MTRADAKAAPNLQLAQQRLAGKAALVTGGMGFIGSNLARRLVGLGARVTVVDCMLEHSGGNPFNLHGLEDLLRLENIDIRDSDALKGTLAGQEFVFHLAAHTSHTESMRDPLLDLSVNALGTLTLLEAVRATNAAARVVCTGTRQVYGTPRYLPVSEDHPYAPPDINGIHKLAADWYGKLYSQVHGMRVTSLRLTNTFGPRMRIRDARQMFLGAWIKQLLQGQPLRVFGSGEQRRDFNHVEDVLDALLLSTDDSTSGGVFNLGGHAPISLRELAQTMVSELGFAGTFEMVAFPPERKQIDIGDYHGDFSAFSALTGWRPARDFVDGLRQTVRFYAEHSAQYFA